MQSGGFYDSLSRAEFREVALTHWRIRFPVSSELSEPLGDLLTELGAIAVTLENAGADAFYEVAYPDRPSWSRINVSGLFPEHVDTDLIEHQVRSSMGESISGEVSSIADEDWERTWLSGYEPIQVGPRLWVTPSWLKPPVADAVNLAMAHIGGKMAGKDPLPRHGRETVRRP